MKQAEQTLVNFLLPEEILDYFEVLKVEKDSIELQIYLEEKNTTSFHELPNSTTDWNCNLATPIA